MREFLPEFRGEHETRICGDAFEPLFSKIRTQGLIERRIDFNRVKKFREISSFVETARAFCWINNACPVSIGPSGGTDENLLRRIYGSRFGHERFAARVS